MSEDVKNLSENSFKKEIEKGLFLVDFYADWCGPCRTMTPILEQVAKEMQGKVTVVKVDVDQAQSVAGTYQVNSIPTLILFKDGKEVGRVVGVREANTLKEFINGAA